MNRIIQIARMIKTVALCFN